MRTIAITAALVLAATALPAQQVTTVKTDTAISTKTDKAIPTLAIENQGGHYCTVTEGTWGRLARLGPGEKTAVVLRGTGDRALKVTCDDGTTVATGAETFEHNLAWRLTINFDGTLNLDLRVPPTTK